MAATVGQPSSAMAASTSSRSSSTARVPPAPPAPPATPPVGDGDRGGPRVELAPAVVRNDDRRRTVLDGQARVLSAEDALEHERQGRGGGQPGPGVPRGG